MDIKQSDPIINSKFKVPMGLGVGGIKPINKQATVDKPPVPHTNHMPKLPPGTLYARGTLGCV